MTYFKKFVDMARTGDYLILDTETTGLRHAEICQIAIIDKFGDIKLVAYVKPTKPIPADASAIHGITDEMVAKAPGWHVITHQVQAILKATPNLIVYNANFDRHTMHSSAEHAGIGKVEWKEITNWWCAMEAYAPYAGDWNEYHQSYRWQKLTRAAHLENVEITNAHNALGDCLMTLGVVKAMVKAVHDE